MTITKIAAKETCFACGGSQRERAELYRVVRAFRVFIHIGDLAGMLAEQSLIGDSENPALDYANYLEGLIGNE